MTGLNYIKMPRNVTEYTLMKGVTDFSNLKQFDLFESGYSFLTVVSVPRFMQLLAAQDTKVKNLQDGIVHIMEGEFRGLDGIPDVTADAGTITNGANEMQLINNVTMDTSIQVTMSFFERSGSLITNYLNYYLTGIKDPYSKAKTYHGLIGSSVTDPGPDYEVFTFLYYVTDNTMRSIEKAYLLCNAQPITAPNGTLYNVQRGTHDFQELSLTFNCYPIVGDQVNMYAAMMLQNDLTTSDTSRMLILDSNDYKYDVYASKAEDSNGFGLVGDILGNQSLANEVASRTNSGIQLGTNRTLKV